MNRTYPFGAIFELGWSVQSIDIGNVPLYLDGDPEKSRSR
jgi:hypothetical protein